MKMKFSALISEDTRLFAKSEFGPVGMVAPNYCDIRCGRPPASAGHDPGRSLGDLRNLGRCVPPLRSPDLTRRPAIATALCGQRSTAAGKTNSLRVVTAVSPDALSP